MITQCQALQTAGQSYIVHSLVETITKGQLQQAARQCYIIHALIEIITKGQAMRTAGQSYHVCNHTWSFNAFIETATKGQALAPILLLLGSGGKGHSTFRCLLPRLRLLAGEARYV